MSHEKTRELVDLLRRNYLYQLPRPVFVSAEAERPVHLIMRMRTDDYERMMNLLDEAGGWDLPPEKKAQMVAAKEAGRIACPHGTDWRRCRACLGEKTARELGETGHDNEH